MGSPYLLPHILDIPIHVTKTTVVFPSTGQYRIWIRNRACTVPWKVSGAPGKFQVMIDGQLVKETFGFNEEEWHWYVGSLILVQLLNVRVLLTSLKRI